MFWTIIGIICALILIAFTLLRLMIAKGGSGVNDENPLSYLIELGSSIQAKRLSNNDLELSWKTPNATAVLSSTDPDHSDQQLLSKLSGEFRYLHSGSNPNQRTFYTVQHQDNESTHIAERHWHLPGILNLRDIGGYETADGQVTRWGKVYRTAHLGNATDHALEILNQHNVALICDLRSSRELEENPDRVPTKTTYLHTPIYKEDQLSGIFPKLLFNRAALGDQLGAGYIRMVDERAEAFAGIIGRFADPSNLPAMFHCTAGKDRAGLTAAMLLDLLGVPRQTIIADYSLSNLASEAIYTDFMENSAHHITRLGVPPEQLKPLFIANPKWLENALNHIDQNYDGVERYLIEQGRLSAEKIGALRGSLLA